MIGSGLHLHENHDGPIPGNNVNFANSGAVASGKDCVPVTDKFFASSIFRTFSKLNGFRTRHTQIDRQDASQHDSRPTGYNGRL